jgi:F-type H+-transporting ATPase subunit c
MSLHYAVFWKKAKKRRREVQMSKKVVIVALTTVLVLGMATMALAEDGSAKAAGMWIFFAIAIACGFGIGIAALGTGLAMGNAISTARNPEAGGKIMTTMIIGLALIESLCIYALLITLLMVFKIPTLEAVIKGLGG